jgi:hypothetical protein
MSPLLFLVPLLACDASTSDVLPDSQDSVLDSPIPETARISGVVYQFQSHQPLEGATVTLEEYPELSTTSDAAGAYVLEGVPLGERVTPKIELSKHVNAWHQSLVLEGDLDMLYFQAIPTTTFGILKSLLEDSGLTVDLDTACAVVTTVSDTSMAEVQGWEAFLERGDAGQLAGATAEIGPESGLRLYFNEDVRPDPTVELTTTDGGVLWVNVAPGDYTLSASHPDASFPQVDIDCEAGRFINASPPKGLTALVE